MIKTMKRITLGLVIALAVVCMGIFAAACDKNEDGGDAYVITVNYPDGTAVNGKTQGTAGVDSNGNAATYVMVQLCDADNESSCLIPVALGENGKVSISFSSIEENALLKDVSTFAVHLNGLPAGYTYDDNYTVSKSNKEITITLKAQ